MDFRMSQRQAELIGEERGRAEGELKKAKETAYELHAMGMQDTQIARAVKVDIDHVQRWLAEPQAT